MKTNNPKHEMTYQEYLNIYKTRFLEIHGRQMTTVDEIWVRQDWEYERKLNGLPV